MFTTLINKITDILKANTLIQEVYNYEAEQFGGDPVAIVSPSNNESAYSSNQNNHRVYAFNIKLFVVRNSEAVNRKPIDADRILRNLIDSIIDDFDKDYTFANLTTPLGYTMINVFAVPSQWGYAGREDEYRVAEILLRCRVAVDVTAIS